RRRGCYIIRFKGDRSLRKMSRFAVSVVVCVAASLYSVAALPEAGHRPLWKIQSKEDTVYLLGSIHYLKPKSYPLDAAIEGAFKDAKKVIFEIDLASAQGDEAQHTVLSKAAYGDGTTLQQHLSDTTYQLTAEKVKQLGL